MGAGVLLEGIGGLLVEVDVVLSPDFSCTAVDVEVSVARSGIPITTCVAGGGVEVGDVGAAVQAVIDRAISKPVKAIMCLDFIYPPRTIKYTHIVTKKA